MKFRFRKQDENPGPDRDSNRDLTVTPHKGDDSLQTRTVQTFERAQMADNPQLRGWIGPVGRLDMKGQDMTRGNIETVRGAENTLLLFEDCIVAFSVTQNDFDNLGLDPEGYMGVISGLRSYDNDDPKQAKDERMRLELAYYKSWDKIIEKMNQVGTSKFIDAHFNFRIARDQIDFVEAKNRFLNPGVFVHLRDGQTFKYSSFRKDLIDSFGAACASVGIQTR